MSDPSSSGIFKRSRHNIVEIDKMARRTSSWDDGANERLKNYLTKEGNVSDEDFLLITVNEVNKKYVLKAWLDPAGGRAAGSALSKMLLGTNEGICGGRDLTLEPKLVEMFDPVCLWLALGDGALLSDTIYQRRSRDLYELATYFGLDSLAEKIKSLGWSTEIKGEVVSTNNQGVIVKLVPWKGFGFVLDKVTREQVWFQMNAVHTSDNSKEEFCVGQECRYDVHVRRKGRKPNQKSARNIVTLSGDPFKKINCSDQF